MAVGGAISWVSSGGGDWGTGSSWSSGAVPDPSTDALDALPGVVTISSPSTAHSLTINNTSGTIEVLFSALALSGLLNVQAGAFVLDGTLTGGTIAAAGGSFLLGGFSSTVSGITYEGTLTLGLFQYLTIDGITLLGAGGIGAGTLAVTEGQAIFGVTQTLAAGTITLGNQGLTPAFPPVLSVSQGATLTLGAQALVQTTGNSEVVSGTIVNTGTIAALVNGDTLSISGTLLNQGLIAIGQGDDVVISPGTTLSNTGTVVISGGGTLDLWGGLVNSGSISAAGGTIMADGAVTLAELLALKADGGALVLAGTLDNSGAVIQVGSSAALGMLVLTGTIRNGTIRDQGGGLVLNGGTLDGVTYQGTLGVGTNPFHANAIIDGLTLGNGGTLIITSGLLFGNTETVVAGVIDLGNPAGPASFGASAGAAVTFGAGVDIEQTGTTIGIGGSYSAGFFSSLQAGQVFKSLGTIDAGFAGGTMVLGYAAELINAGLMEVQNGATLLAQGTLLNAGTLLLGSGGTLAVTSSSSWSNTGTVRGTSGTVVLTGPVTNAELASFAGSGAMLVQEGLLDNSAGTLAIGNGSTLGVLALGPGGTIRGGVVRDGGGGLVGAAGTLDGVTYQGTLGLIHPNDLLTVTDGITMTGASGPGSAIALTGNGAALVFANGQTLTATIAIGAASAEADLETGGPGVLTLGPSTVITQVGWVAGMVASGGTIANQGTIQATLPGGHFNLAATGGMLLNSGTIDAASMDVATIGSLTNAGQVTVTTGAVLTIGQYSAAAGAALTESGATLDLNGTLSLAALATLNRSGGIVAIGGTLDLGGGTLAVGSAAALNQLRDLGVVQNGTIADSGGGMVYYGGVGALQNVTYRGLVNLTPALSNVAVQNLTVTAASGTGPGTVNLLGAGSTLTFLGSQIFGNATINFGSNAQADVIAIRDPTGTGAVLTLGSTANLQHRGTLAQIVIDRGLGDGLINRGMIAANNSGGQLVILGGTFTNAGQVVVANGDTLALQADQVSNLIGNTLSGGYWEVDSNSTLNLGMDDPIVTLNAPMVLNGAGAQVIYYDTTRFQNTSLDQTLQYVGAGGVLVVENGRTFGAAGLLHDISTINLSAGTLSASTLVIDAGGLLAGSGAVTASNIYDSGHVLAQNGELVVNGPLLIGAPAGNALIAAGATLAVNGVSNVPIQFLANTGTLVLGQSMLTYGAIIGLTGSDAIDLINVGTAGVSLNYTAGSGNGVLTVKSGASTIANLHFNGNYVLGNFSVASDGHGGTLILDPPVPAASPDWQVTLADFGAPPATAEPDSAAAGGTIAGNGAIVMLPEAPQASVLAHQ